MCGTGAASVECCASYVPFRDCCGPSDPSCGGCAGRTAVEMQSRGHGVPEGLWPEALCRGRALGKAKATSRRAPEAREKQRPPGSARRSSAKQFAGKQQSGIHTTADNRRKLSYYSIQLFVFMKRSKHAYLSSCCCWMSVRFHWHRC